ncbi:MAG: HEAT repeat domain-containing protein [Actinobacteria bacterium]|nr:HEAT repeat domain-containing protein [Actinomycetota bacterium]
MTLNSDDDSASRRRSVVTAGHLGKLSVEQEGLLDTDAEVRASALAAMQRMGMLSSEDLIAGLTDPAAVTRRRAAVIAASYDSAQMELRQLLSDSDDSVVEVAAFACGERTDADLETVQVLCQLAGAHEDALCREAAVAALGSIGNPAGLPAVIAGCSDRATVRRRAVLSLAAFEGPQVTAMLRKLTQDRDLQVRQAAEELLAIELGEQL